MAMRFLISLMATLVFSGALTAEADLVWTVDATTSDGSPLTAVTPGAELILDITARTTGSYAVALAGHIADYDPSVVTLDPASSLISSNLMVSVATGPGTGVGGIPNSVSPANFQEQLDFLGVGTRSQFFIGVSLTSAAGQGELDQGVVTGAAGDPQFRVVMDVVGLPGDSTTLDIGTFREYAEVYAGFESPGADAGVPIIDQNVVNQFVTVVVAPEPGTAVLLGLGLGGLATRRTRRLRAHAVALSACGRGTIECLTCRRESPPCAGPGGDPGAGVC